MDTIARLTSAFVLAITTSSAAMTALAATPKQPNIVIDSQEETVRLVPDKSGNIAELKRSLKANFVANHDDGHATDYISYDLYTRLDKATAPKAQKHFGPAYGNGIFYSDSKACIITFPVTKKNGATLEVERTFIDPDFFSGDVIGEVYQVNSLKLTYIIPTTLRKQFTYEVRHAGNKLLNVDETDNGRESRITFTFDTIPALANEPRSTPMRYWAPQVLWRGLYPDPQAVYRKLRQYASMSDPNPEAIKKLATDITKGCATDYDKITAINNWVHDNIRYIAVEYGELGRKPEFASVVAANRYGDCKGSANLTRDLLKGVGIDGRLVWIATNSFPYAWSDVPTLGSGNHMIAAAVVADSITFIDGTATHFPLGLYPRSIQGQEAMIENGDNCLLKTVPVIDPTANSLNSIEINYSITDDLELTGAYRSVSSGHERVAVLSTLDAYRAADRADIIGLMAVNNRSGLKASETNLNHLSDTEIELTATLSGKGTLKQVGQKLRLSLLPDTDIDPYIVDAKKRTMPLWLNRCHTNRSVVTLAVPQGYRPDKLPKSHAVSNEWFDGSVDFSVSPDGGTITCTSSWTLKVPIVDTPDVAAFTTAMRQLQRAFNATLTLAPAEVAGA